MKNQHNHLGSEFPEKSEIQELLRGTINSAHAIELLERIKQNEPNDDFGRGLKAYLNQNGASIETLRLWINRVSKRQLNRNRRRQFPNYRHIAAASVIILLSLSIGYIATRNEDQTWKLYYKTDPGFPVLMGNNVLNAKWMQQYRAGNFRETLHLLNSIPNSDTIQYYRAACFFELGEIDSSQMQLNKLNSSMQGRTELLKAFCLWRQGEIQQSIQIFETLCATENGIAASQACRIVSEAFDSRP